MRNAISIRNRKIRAKRVCRSFLIEHLEDRRMMNVDWRSPVNSLDINADGRVAPLDALLVINELNANGIHALPSTKDPDKSYFDVDGNQAVQPLDALLAINALNRRESPPVALQESSLLTNKYDVTITVGQTDGTRKYSVQLDPTFDTSDNVNQSHDVLAVYVLNPDSLSDTLVDRGQNGTALFSLSETGVEFAPGLVRWDGQVAEFDLSQITGRDTAILRFQLVNNDNDLNSKVAITPLTNDVDPDGVPSSFIPVNNTTVLAGPALIFSSFSAQPNVTIDLENVRYDEITQTYKAELKLDNKGGAIGRNVAVLFDNLPNGVTLKNPSGTNGSGKPYINFSPAIDGGGLTENDRSAAIEVAFKITANKSFGLSPKIFASINHAPVLAPISPLITMPGAVLRVPLNATDADQDLIAYSIVSVSSPSGTGAASKLPASSIEPDGTLTFRPTKADIGTYQFDVFASDGSLKAKRSMTLTVKADATTTTRVSGKVLRINGQPIVGMKVSIGPVQGLTKSDGSFLLDLGNGTVASDTIKVHGDLYGGSVKFPFIAEKLALLLKHDLLKNINNVIDRPIYLITLDTANGKKIDPTKDTLVTTAAIPGVGVMVKAGSLMNQQGSPFTGDLSITRVPIDRTPAALPPNLFPDMVVTIQPGEMVFTTPAPMTFPNTAGWAPGTLMDLWSINPVTGQFDDAGDMRVSADGLKIETISGGVRNSSWHLPTPQPRDPKDETKPPECPCEGQEVFLSNVGLYSGTHLITHELAEYQSQGVSRGIALHYDSARAHPMEAVRFSYDVVAGTPTQPPPEGIMSRMMATLTLSHGETRIELPGAATPTSGRHGNKHFWNIDDLTIGQRVGAALTADLTNLPTGLYAYELSSGIARLSNAGMSATLSTLRGQLRSINSIDSPFGSGWGVAGVQEIVENGDGSVLLVDGNGSELLFRPVDDASGSEFVSPPSDFSTLRRLADGRYQRRMTDGEVYDFDSKRRLASVTDRNKNATRYEYNGTGLLIRIVDPVNQATTFEYFGGHISKITSPDGRVTHLTVDKDGNLTEVKHPDNARQSWAYDGRHLLIAEVDPRGNRSVTEYNDLGRVVRGFQADGVELQIQSATNRGSYSAARTADPTNAPPADTSFEPTAFLVAANGNVIRRTLTPGGRIQTSVDQLGQMGHVDRNQQGLVTRVTNGRGIASDFSYDSRGNRTELRDRVPNEDSGGGSNQSRTFPGRQFDVGERPSSAVTADINRDGHADVITANASSDDVSVLYGDGKGGLELRVNFAVGDSPNSAISADVNGDNRLDLITANLRSDNVSVLLGDGAGGFSSAIDYAAGIGPRAVVAGEINGDSRIDLVVLSETAAIFAVLLGDGSGGFASPVNFAAGGRPRSMAVADVNGDGSLDLVAADDPCCSTDTVLVRLNDGVGGFAPAVTFAAGDGPHAIIAIDLNGDNRVELVTANDSFGSTDTVSVMINDGAGGFAPRVNYPVPGALESVIAADVDDDGQLDLITANGVEGDVSVLLGDGLGGFAARESFSAGGYISSVAAADLDEDGRVDLITANNLSDNVTVLLGDSVEEFSAAVNYNAEDLLNSATAADVDGDGRLDLIMAHATTDRVSVAVGDGAGRFSPPTFFAAGDRPIAAIAARVNSDDRLDLITANQGSNNISVLLGESGGRFATAVNFPTGAGPVAVVAADLNGDTLLDLITANQSSTSISVLLGKSGGSFATAVNFPTGNSPVDVVAADMNGDSRLDLIAAINDLGSADSVLILLGDGAGNFANAMNLSSADAQVSIFAADVNGDEDPDLIMANDTFSSVDSVTVLLSDGAGGFSGPVSYPAGTDPVSAVAADVNDDGHFDLITANRGSANVSVLLGDGAGNFADRVNYTVGKGPRSVDIADINSDDKLDLVTANEVSGTVSVLLSRPETIAGGETVRQYVEYDAVFSRPTSITDGLGHVTAYEIDSATGNLLRAERPNDSVMIYTYTPSGLIDTMVDPNGHVVDYDYDTLDRLTKIRSALVTSDESTTRYEYDAAGNVIAVIDGKNQRTKFEYDSVNRLTLIRDAQGNTTRYRYDLAGNVIEMRDARSNVTTYGYDELNRLTRTTDAQGKATRYQYDRSGNLTSLTDPLGHVTRHRYDLRNRRTETTDPDGGVTQFHYDAEGNMTELTDPVGNRTLFFYDGRDRLIKEVDPLGKEIKYAYDGADNLVQKTDRNGRETRYTYDSLNRLTKEKWVGNANEITYAYDPSGNVVTVRDTFSSLAYTYDASNRVRTVNNNATPGAPKVLLSYSYDAASNVTSVVDTINGAAGATTAYQYDARNLQTHITQTGNGLANKRVDLSYNPLGQFVTINRFANLSGTQSVIRSDYSYDTLNRLTSLTHKHGTANVASYGFKYDVSSRITSITDIDGTTNYSYDDRDQLKAANHSNAANPDESYAYDANGNRTSSSLHGSGYVTGPGNRLLSDGTYKYVYDNEGNTIRRTEIATAKVREFKWDYRNRLTAVIDKNAAGTKTQEVRFTYDALDRRIFKAVDTNPTDAIDAVLTHFVYDREDVLMDFVDRDGSGPQAPILAERYLHGPGIDQVLAQDDGAGSVQWHLTDHLGTVRDLVDNGGVLVNHLVYDSFGNVVAETNAAVESRYLFTGREHDADTGLHYYRSRYYSIEIGRFLSEDAIRHSGLDLHLYRYVLNTPVLRSDPGGKDPVDVSAVDVSNRAGRVTAVARDLNIHDIQINRVSGLDDFLSQLASYGPGEIRNLEVVGHGFPGGFFIGNDQIDLNRLRNDPVLRRKLQDLATRLARGANVQLKTCRTGKGSEGQQFLQELSRLLNAVTAASETPQIGPVPGLQGPKVYCSAGSCLRMGGPLDRL